MTKEVTLEQFNKFWELFDEKHLDISFQLTAKTLINGSIITFKPAKMHEETYDKYTRFLKRWYMDNGFLDFAPDFVYVATNDNDAEMKAIEIDTAKILSIEPVEKNDKICKVIIKEDEGINKELIIKESVEYFKNRSDIF
jgi:tRNA-binding EMAP/Myf-like protein